MRESQYQASLFDTVRSLLTGYCVLGLASSSSSRLQHGRVVGGRSGAKARDDVAVPSDEELLEVPGDVARLALGVGDLGELGVERVAALRR